MFTYTFFFLLLYLYFAVTSTIAQMKCSLQSKRFATYSSINLQHKSKLNTCISMYEFDRRERELRTKIEHTKTTQNTLPHQTVARLGLFVFVVQLYSSSVTSSFL